MNKKPHKKARKIVIDNEVWWWVVGSNSLIVWDPNGEKCVKDFSKIFPDMDLSKYEITPFRVRNVIDFLWRDVDLATINDRIKERKRKAAAERRARMAEKRRSVMAHAKELVLESNARAHEFYGGDPPEPEVRADNEKFIEDLRDVLAYYATQKDSQNDE